ncbi:hypothetical protein EV363DRAFT_1408203 [Boletus edulis]|nr:hypothetical protein EV363DRAFT_1408203 [Boletus edulis]
MLLLTSTLFTFGSFVVYNIAFGLARLALLPLLLRIPLLRSLLRPFFGHSISGPWILTLPLRYLSLESHAFTLALSMLANWEFAASLFDVYIPPVASATADPNVTLVSGITSTNPCRVAPSMWSTLARESLLRLGHGYQTFLRRGAHPPADVPALAVPPKAVEAPSISLLRWAIFKAQEQSPVAKVLAGVTTPQQNLIGTYVSRAKARCRGLVVKYTPCRELRHKPHIEPESTSSACSPSTHVLKSPIYPPYLALTVHYRAPPENTRVVSDTIPLRFLHLDT